MKGQMPVVQARPLSETVGTSDIDQLLHAYVKPAFIRLSPANRQKAIDYLKKLADDSDAED